MYATMAASLAASFRSVLLGFAIGAPISRFVKRRRVALRARATVVVTDER